MNTILAIINFVKSLVTSKATASKAMPELEAKGADYEGFSSAFVMAHNILSKKFKDGDSYYTKLVSEDGKRYVLTVTVDIK